MKKKSQKPTSKNNNSPEFTEKDALAFLGRQLDQAGMSYHYSKNKKAIHSGFNGTDAIWDFSMYAAKKHDDIFLLGVNSFIPNHAPVERRLACAELLTCINYGLMVGCFEFNSKHGNIRFRTSVILPAGDITPGTVEQLMKSNLCIVDEYLHQILAVLHSNMTPEEAMKPREEKSENKPTRRLELN
jgi:hypothetical protein